MQKTLTVSKEEICMKYALARGLATKKMKTETHKRKGYLLHSSVSFHSKDCFAAIVMFKISFIQPLMSSICRSMREWSLTFNIILYNKDDTFGILGL